MVKGLSQEVRYKAHQKSEMFWRFRDIPVPLDSKFSIHLWLTDSDWFEFQMLELGFGFSTRSQDKVRSPILQSELIKATESTLTIT
jgi:hypothetical protein